MKINEYVMEQAHREKLTKVYTAIANLAQSYIDQIVKNELPHINDSDSLNRFHTKYQRIYKIIMTPDLFTVEELRDILGYFEVNATISNAMKD